jgi:hypothetical protein
MASVTVDVDVDLNDFEDKEIIDELTYRGYNVSKEVSEEFSNEDWDMMLSMFDNVKETWETRRLRDKIFKARHG